MAWINIPATGGGGGGAVDSVNGQTGVVVLTKSDIGLGNVNNTSDLNKPISTATQTALDAKQATITGGATSIVSSNLTVGRALVSDGSGKVAVSGTLDSELGYLSGATSNIQAQLDNKAAAISGNNNRIIRKNNSGAVVSDDTLQSTDIGELIQAPNFNIVDGGGRTSLQLNTVYTPTEDAPNASVNTIFVNPTVADTGFELGRTGTAVNLINSNFVHNSETDIGGINLLTQSFSLGNGVDPVAVKGVGYSFGFGQVNANVTVDGPIQGYGFQPSLDAASTMDSYMVAFYDNANVATKVNGYQSLNLSPQIEEIGNNNNYTGINLNPQIDNFEGNSSATALSIAGIYENFGTGGANFLNINPTANDSTARYLQGIYVSMDNVSGYPGVQSSLVFQDLTYTWIQAGDNDNYTLAYIGGGTAGSEIVSVVGTDITVQIESGVSTATQIKAAVDGTSGINTAISVTISGTASNPQVTAGPTNFSGGEFPASVRAAYLDGNVEITGSLTFGGALSIGQLNAFASQAVVTGSGNPASIHNLISQPTVGNNETIALGDTIGVNTAMLLTVGTNSTVTSALVGLSALALPAVVNLGAGSTVDRVAGATFAISLDVGAAGTITNLDLCRAVGLPNGTTTVTNLKGYAFDLPFGDPGTTSWGFYESPGVNNYFQGNLLIGGTAGSDDTVTNSSVALEIKSTTKAFVNARMTTAERDALTAINGAQIYNTSTDKLQVYAAGNWVDLH